MNRTISLFLAALALFCAPHASAQEVTADELVAAELRALTRAVEKIAVQLEKEQRQRQEDVRFRQLSYNFV